MKQPDFKKIPGHYIPVYNEDKEDGIEWVDPDPKTTFWSDIKMTFQIAFKRRPYNQKGKIQAIAFAHAWGIIVSMVALVVSIIALIISW